MKKNAGDMKDFKLDCKLFFKSIGIFCLVIFRLCEYFFLGLKRIFEDIDKSQKKNNKRKSNKKKTSNFFEEFQNFI